MKRSLVWRLIVGGLVLMIAPPVLLICAFFLIWLAGTFGDEFQAANTGMFLALTAAIPTIGLMILGAILALVGLILTWLGSGKKPAS